LGDIHSKQGNSAGAIRTWEKGYEGTRNPVFFLKLEDTYLQLSEPEKILNEYKKAISQNPQDIDLSLLQARLFLRLEMVDEAITELERIRSDVEESYYLDLLLGEAHLRRSNSDKAAALFKKALSHDKEVPPAFVCNSCAYASGEWLTRCTSCGRWDTYRLSRTTAAGGAGRGGDESKNLLNVNTSSK
ncbi:MAG: tetratricopeptide repeat protein, partial [Thermodesulfobacteriota bacterium]